MSLLLSIDRLVVRVQCCFTSTETIRTIRVGEPRTATSSFTQLLGSTAIDSNQSISVLFYVLFTSR